MQDKIRQLLTDNPRAMNAAYAAVLGTSILWEVSADAITGATAGP